MYLKIITATVSIAVMAGCNTMSGAGKDVQSGGTSLPRTAPKRTVFLVGLVVFNLHTRPLEGLATTRLRVTSASKCLSSTNSCAYLSV